MPIVPKAWGEERILVNEREYCAKVLVVKKGAGSSWHRHLKKKESFICLKGKAVLKVESPDPEHPFEDIKVTVEMVPKTCPVTIYPGEWHQFHGVEDSEILEVSTHDDPADCERRTQSYGTSENHREA